MPPFARPCTYAQFVTRLAKPGRDILALLTPGRCHLNHMLVGITGELGELAKAVRTNDLVNIKEEAGDLRFYIQGVVNHFALPIELDGGHQKIVPAVVTDVNAALLELLEENGEINDLVKQETVYAKVPVADAIKITETLFRMLSLIAGIEYRYGFTQDEVLDHNFEKLSARYGKVYSDAAAAARADKN